jgi:hypothetical protein
VGPHPYLAVGERVFIKSGPFAGLDGVLLRSPKWLNAEEFWRWMPGGS